MKKKSLRQELARVTREKIKNAGRSCFQRDGYRLTTIRQIAAEAGTTPNTLYQYFDGKASILVELCHDYEPELLEVARALDALLPTLSAKSLKGWLADYTKVWLANRAAIEAYWEALGEAEIADHFWPLANKQVAEMKYLISRFPANRSEDIKLRMSLCFIHTSQTLFVAYSSRRSDQVEQMLDALADILLNSLDVWRHGELVGAASNDLGRAELGSTRAKHGTSRSARR